MYRKYKGKFTNNGLRPFSAAAYLSDVESLPSRPNSTMSLSGVEFSLETTREEGEDIDKVWDIVDSQCQQHERDKLAKDTTKKLSISSSLSSSTRQEWRTVRIFVSSTFTDFHNEREVLVKQVFPALREWCESRKLALVECDLRWGVPKDSTSAMTVSTCMSELDRCHEETDGEPFFINMLSERYGWVPGPSDLPDDLMRSYDWVDGVSITHMEILHGAYRSRNPNAVFFIRNPTFLQGLPFNMMGGFVDDHYSSKVHLKTLKRKILDHFPADQVFDYHCKYDGVDRSTGREKVALDGLDHFASLALQFFQEAIEKKYPNRSEIGQSFSQYDQEEDVHLSVMEVKSTFVRGRDAELDVLMNYSTGRTGGSRTDRRRTRDRRSDTHSRPELEVMMGRDGKVATLNGYATDLLDRQGGLPSDPPPVCIVGDPGIGKSALVACLAKQAIQAGLPVLYHCVGCTADSFRDIKILARIVWALKGPDSQDKTALPENIPELSDKLKELSELWRRSDKQMLIIVDGVNEVSDAASPHCLSWMPVRLPANIRLVVTVTAGHHACLSRLSDRQARALLLPPIDDTAKREIVEHFFSRYNKRLDSTQQSALLSKTSSSVPLWLSLAVEELRVFGDFRTLTRKIQTLPEGLEGLLQVILNRLVKEDSTGCMIKALSLIYCSQDGLPEAEMTRLLGNLEVGEEVATLTWATVRRALRPFVQSVVYWYNGGLKIQFSHRAVYQAVGQLLFESPEDERRCHTSLADYYQYHCGDQTYTLEDLPYHLYQAGLHKRIADFYHHDRRSIAGSQHFRQKYLNMIRCERHTPDIKNLSRPAKICQFCANKTGLVSPLPHPTKSVCIVCGAWIVSHPSMQTVARLCVKHCGRFGPTTDQCYFCDRVIQGNAGGNANLGLICQMCNSGRRHHTCAKLVL